MIKHPDEVRKDFFGRWIHSGSYPIPFKAKVTEDDMELECCAPGATGEVYYLRVCCVLSGHFATAGSQAYIHILY